MYAADVSTTMIVRPGPVIDFLLANQNARNPSELDWAKVLVIYLLFISYMLGIILLMTLSVVLSG